MLEKSAFLILCCCTEYDSVDFGWMELRVFVLSSCRPSPRRRLPYLQGSHDVHDVAGCASLVPSQAIRSTRHQQNLLDFERLSIADKVHQAMS